MSKKNRLLKRLFDIILALIGLIVTSLIIIIAFSIAAFETKSNGIFVQNRVGKNARIIKVYKIKTMKNVTGTTVTTANDTRITSSGKIFRKTKIDELPQLWNVLKGDMSFVGPRPDVPGYADKLEGEDRIILTIRPGITGPASIKYKNEEELLSQVDNPKLYNDTVIYPDKVQINKEYIYNYKFRDDLKYIWKTIF